MQSDNTSLHGRWICCSPRANAPRITSSISTTRTTTTPEVNKEKAWLDHIRARRNVLDEELQQLQRIQERADIVHLDDHRNQ